MNYDKERPLSAHTAVGPSLLRESLESSRNISFQDPLKLSTLGNEDVFRPIVEASPISTSTTKPSPTLNSSADDMEEVDVRSWSTQQVAAWMFGSEFENDIISKFELHDINGTVLLDLSFDDLRELDISSYGKRRQIWNELSNLRREGGYSSHKAALPTVERACTPDSEGTRERSRRPGFGAASYSRKRESHEKIVLQRSTLGGSDQLIPKPHRCSKGEKCSKYRKQQRIIERVDQDHGPNTPPAEPEAALPEFRPISLRPRSEAVPSVVASSDILGAGALDQPAFEPDAAMMEKLRMRRNEAQENVKQYLELQKMHPSHFPDTPPSPVKETMRPNTQSQPASDMFSPPHPPRKSSLYGLPPLSIPRSPADQGPKSATLPPRRCSRSPSPSPHLSSPAVSHLRSPASDSDIPLASIPTPVDRQASNSVPPEFQLESRLLRSTASFDNVVKRRDITRMPTLKEARASTIRSRSQNRISKPLPSIPLPTPPLPSTEFLTQKPLPPNAPNATEPQIKITSPSQKSGTSSASPPTRTVSPTSSQKSDIDSRKLTTPSPPPVRAAPSPPNVYGSGVLRTGWVRRRRARLWRHEWQAAHARLNGTKLFLHATSYPDDQAPIDVIDIDDYVVSCSAAASGNKFSSAVKSFKVSGSQNGKDVTPSGDSEMFAWQLIPAVATGERPAHGSANPSRSNTTDGSEHSSKSKNGEMPQKQYFAVKSRDERIEWVREVMLAKKNQQKLASQSGASSRARTSVEGGLHPRAGSF